MKKTILLTALITLTGLANAQAVKVEKVPNPTTEPPYIVLSDNIDEPNGYGFCIDTQRAGQSDLLHSHSCKPAKKDDDGRGSDVRFWYNTETKQVTSFPYKGYCMQALIAGKVTVFALLECSDHSRQHFVYSNEDKTLRLEEDQKRCVGVESKTQAAGPWVSRSLEMLTCDETDNSLKQWTIIEK